MKTSTMLCATAVVLVQALCASAAGGERQQQLPLFFQAGRPFNAPGAPLPKFVGIAGNQQPQAFRSLPPQVDEELDDEEQRSEEDPNQRSSGFSTPLPFRPQPTPQFNQFRASPSPSPQTLQPTRINRPTETPARRPPPPPQSQFKPLSSKPLSEQEEAQELEEEKEQPDRLTELLPQSKFTCSGKKTGYYADDGLDCEVFHYCQDNARHSWICPEGFVFHQVNLICMPPSAENICQQSTQYHFVNDFLYRPVNQDEVNARPNTTLRYSDRYYPGSSFEVAEEEYEEDAPPQHRPQHLQQQQFRQQPQPQAPRQRIQQQQSQQQVHVVSSTPRPIVLQQPQQAVPQFARQQPNQVFHSSEEVNIPLQQRRPVAPPSSHRPNFQLQQQQLQHQQQQQQNEFDFRRK